MNYTRASCGPRILDLLFVGHVVTPFGWNCLLPIAWYAGPSLGSLRCCGVFDCFAALQLHVIVL